MRKSLKGRISKKGRSNKTRGRGSDLYFVLNSKVYTHKKLHFEKERLLEAAINCSFKEVYLIFTKSSLLNHHKLFKSMITIFTLY